GRSPTLVVGFLKTLSHDGGPSSRDVTPIASTIPAGGLDVMPAHITFREYYRHFEAFLPPDVLAGERAVVLIDNLQTGASVEHLARILEAYYADRGVAGTVIRSGFHQAGAPFGFVSLPAARYEAALRSDGDGVAEFSRHRIWFDRSRGERKLEDLSANPRHGKARDELAGHMAREATLDRTLRTRFPDLVASTAL